MPSLLRPFWGMVKFVGFDWLEAGIPRAKRASHRKQKICVCEEILNFLAVGTFVQIVEPAKFCVQIELKYRSQFQSNLSDPGQF